MPRKPGDRNRDFEQKRSTILDRLEERLLRPDGARVTLNEMATVADVSVSSLRHHVGGRPEVWAAMLARCAALELGEHQIRVNVVAPGIVNAGMARRQMEVDPVFARKATIGLPLGRLQTAEQIAKAAAHLCSDDAQSTTGTTLLVDGGASLFKYE